MKIMNSKMKYIFVVREGYRRTGGGWERPGWCVWRKEELLEQRGIK